MRALRGGVLLALLLAPPSLAKDMSSLYDDTTLASWQQPFREGILWNVDNVIWPRLSAQERQALAGVDLCFPLRGQSGDPLEFYARLGAAADACADRDPPVVVLPIQSIKFFDDLCVAHAWLWRNGYGPETALEYASMLKYGEPGRFGGRYPAPLPALQIPDDALADPVTGEQAQKLLKSAVAFLVLHELGHVLHDHPGYDAISAAKAQANEQEADRFALTVMRRIGVAPFGMLFWFQTAAYLGPNRGDFQSDDAHAAWLRQATHPVTEARLRAIAADLRQSPEDFSVEFADQESGRRAILATADDIDRVAGVMAEPGIQQLIARRGRLTELSALAPRRIGETLGATQDTATGAAFDGVYDGEITAGASTLAIRTLLHRNGDRVTGQYSYGGGQGQLSGVVDGDALLFDWQEGSQMGRGRIVAAPDGAGFSGAWGYGDEEAGGGQWDGTRRPQ
jgi:Peptidase U49